MCAHVCMRACMCVPQVACWTGVGGEQSVTLKDDAEVAGLEKGRYLTSEDQM